MKELIAPKAPVERYLAEVGKVYGRYTVIAFLGMTPKRFSAVYRCRCECGTEKSVEIYPLKKGTVVSCGCYCRERVSANMKTHGRTKTREYNTWSTMIQRCTNPKYTQFADYGGRGISVCDRWMTFALFFEDMGQRPAGHTLDRIDNNGNYCKENCRWADRKTQDRNKKSNRNYTLNGETLCMTEWARRYGITFSTMRKRLTNGWPLERAFTTKSMARQ